MDLKAAEVLGPTSPQPQPLCADEAIEMNLFAG